MSLSREEKLKRCRDCDNNFYNQGNNSHTGECWMLADAEPETIYVVGIHTAWPEKNSYKLGERLSCWTPQRGSGIVKWKAPIQ